MSLLSKKAFIILLVAFLVILSLPASKPLVSAQETTPEAEVTDESVSETEPPIATEQPTEIVTEVTPVTVVPTEVTPSPEVTIAPTTEAETTAEATEPVVDVTEVTPVATSEVPVVTSFSDDFEAFDGTGWLLNGWQATTDGINAYLSSLLPNSSAVINGFNQADFELFAQMRVAANNTGVISFRSNGEAYHAVFNASGSSRLYRGTELLDFYTLPTVTEPVWFNVQIVGTNDTISISVNGIPGIVYTDANPLGAGQILFATGETNTGEVSIDNVIVNVVDPTTVIIPTEATPYPTPTEEPEVTVEVTAEVTVEATAEVTPESTPELDPEALALAKMDDTLRASFEGVEDFGQVLTNLRIFGFRFDEFDNFFLDVILTEGMTREQILAILADVQATNYSFNANNTHILITIAPHNLMTLAQNEHVIKLNQPMLAVSTGSTESSSEAPSGTAVTRGYDILGVENWHNAGFTGAGVNIVVIDTGFPGAVSGTEYGCFERLIGAPGENTQHGWNIVEVLCDIAPNSNVFAISVTNFDSLTSAIRNARSSEIEADIIVIALDFTTTASPGDGTSGRPASGSGTSNPNDPYLQLIEARNEGIAIFTAAGNNGDNNPANYGSSTANDNTGTRISRYTAFNHTGADVTVSFRASADDRILISWSDWSSNPAGNATNLEDFDFTLRLAGGGNIQTRNASRQVISTSPFSSDNPAAQMTVLVTHCPVDENTNLSSCDVELVVNKASGDAGTVAFQVQIVPLQNAFYEELPNNVYISDVSSGQFASGTLARPSDSAAVIAVGAVCANENSNFALLPTSSVGPAFATGGAAPSIPTPNNTTRPHLASVSYVDTGRSDIGSTETNCNGTLGSLLTSAGFGGTSAAVSHVGGMAALLMSNPAMRPTFDNHSASGVDDLLEYLQTHAADLPLTGADSFDQYYGAGLATLGSPRYNLSNIQNPGIVPDALPSSPACASIIYVGQTPVSSTQNGSLSNPYTSLAYAIQQASDCVIVMPGEYVTPLLITKSNIRIYSYHAVHGPTVPRAVIRVSAQYDNSTYQMQTGYTTSTGTVQRTFPNNAGIYIDSASNVTIHGFHFVASNIFQTTSNTHQAIVAYNSAGLVLQNNIFGAGTTDGSSYGGWTSGDTTPVSIFDSDGVRLEGNTFRGNIGGFTSSGAFVIPSVAIVDSGVIGTETQLIRNTFAGNTATATGNVTDLWPSVLFANNSALDMVGNVFNGNTASTFVAAQTLNASTNFPLRMTSNLFINNGAGTINGPFIHAYYVPNLTVMNSTFANNTAAGHTSIVGRGNRLGNGFGTLGTGDAHLDFFNNLIYTTTTTFGVYSSPGSTITTCDNLAGTGDATVRNWWWTTYTGNCSTEMSGNNNIININPATTSEFTGMAVGSLTVNDVNYWGLRQLASSGTDIFSRGIDYSDMTTGTDVNLAVAPFNRDINNQNRVINVENWELNTAHDSGNPETGAYQLDIGAFEFNRLDLAIDEYSPYTPVGTSDGVPTADLLPIYSEDSGNAAANTTPVVIDLNNAIRGGFGQITFVLHQLPDVYGTQCGAAYTSANHGTVLGQGVNNGKIFYCPPLHFYTDPTRATLVHEPPPYPAIFPGTGLTGTVFDYDDDDEWNDYIIFTYVVSDESGAQETGVVLTQINQVNDSRLDAAPAITMGDEIPESDLIRMTGNVGSTIVLDINDSTAQGALRPFAAFPDGIARFNFFLSELTNPEFNDTTNGVYRFDYPYAYSNAVVSDVGDGVIESLSLVDSRLVIQLSDNNTGSSTVTYTVTDLHGATMDVQILVRAVSRIPVDVGMYDDSSFAFDYRDANGTTEGNWTALYDTTAINNTVHRTNRGDTDPSPTVNNGDRVTFGFKNNSGFVLYMKGMGAAGGFFDIVITEIENGTTTEFPSLNTSVWGLYSGSTSVYETTAGEFHCTTTATVGLPRKLSSAVAGFYTITCNNPNHNQVDGATYLVTVTNETNGRFIVIDAFAIIDSEASSDEPINVGYHDVDSLQVRGIFDGHPEYTEIRSALYTNLLAMRTVDPTPSNLTFSVTGGPGFALGTTLQPVSGTYTICVTNRVTAATTCQDFNNTPDPVTVFRNRIFRPFYGLNPNTIYDVTISDISLNPNGIFIIDSIVVFDPTTSPEVPVTGVVEADELEYFVYGGGVEESWRLNLRDATATEMSSMGLTPGIPGAGPYIAFKIGESLSSVYYSYNEALVSQQALICVDRGAGAGTSIADGYGNCLKVNLLTGAYVLIDTNGDEIAPGNMKVSTGTVRIDESIFAAAGRPWNDADADSVHIIEIFSLHDRRLYLDRVIATGPNTPLSAGVYEEYTENIEYLIPVAGSPVTYTAVGRVIGENATAIIANYSGNYTRVSGAGALYDSSRAIMFTREAGNVITFEFDGTGFAPMIRFARDGGALNICWQSYSGAVPPAPHLILSGGTCQHYDTESLRAGYKVPRPIMGLPVLPDNNYYAVAIEFLGDDFNTVNRLPNSVLWFDGVTIYDNDLTSLNPLETGIQYEGNYNTRFTANMFAYYGSTWRYLTSPVFTTYSNRDYDTIAVNAGGATVAFYINDANVVIIDRPLRSGYAPLLVCAQEVGSQTNRSCGIAEMFGAGNRNEFTFPLPAVGDYIVTVTDLDGGAFIFDAVRTENIANTFALTEGKYDDDHPAIEYERSSENLVRNGDMERLNELNATQNYWTANNATAARYALIRYRPLYSQQVQVTSAGGGISSMPFALQTGSTYNFISYVYIPAVTGGSVTVDINNGIFNTVITETNRWIPVHFNFTQGTDLANVVVSFTGEAGKTFYVDDVDLTEGSNWQYTGSPIYYGGFISVNKSRGAEAAFRFTGTGFALGAPTNALTGGEMRVCWLPDTLGDATNADVIINGTCMTYQQQTFINNNNNMRVVTGLASDTYRVVISDVEDGRMNHANLALIGTARNAVYGVGTITLDWVQIFNDEPPATASGIYSESATDAVSGERNLMLEPTDRWLTFAGPTLVAFSDQSYIGAVNTTGLIDSLASGQAASLNLELDDGESATVIFDMAAALPTASNELLACVDGPEGELTFNNGAYRFDFQTDPPPADAHCALLPDLRTSRYITLNSDILPLLANSTGITQTRTLSIQTLTHGMVRIDDFQVIVGNTLIPGYYEESIGASLLVPSDEAAWTTSISPVYSGGAALRSYYAGGVGTQDTQTLTFDFEGTGVSVVTAFLTNGGELQLRVTGNGLDITKEFDDVSTLYAGTRRPFNRYGVSLVVAGLPQGVYTAELTIINEHLENTFIDAIEVYGELPSLGSLYDDADVDVNGVPLIAYGPSNNAWTTLTGTLAATGLNRTLHSGNLRGAIASFEIGETELSRGIVLYYDDRTTAAQVEVCFINVADPTSFNALTDCHLVTVNDNLDTKTVTPDGGVGVPGNYFVTVENISDSGSFALDAVQVLESALTEGIYDAATLASSSPETDTSVTLTGAALVGANIEMTQNEYIELTVDSTGIGFAFVLQNAAGTSNSYEVRVYDSADVSGCATSNTPETHCLAYETLPVTGDTVPAAGPSALTYVGMQGVNGINDYVVQLRNSATGVLRFSHFHVLGQDTSLLLNDAGQVNPISAIYENNDPQIRYLPFGTVIEEVNRLGGASEQSQQLYQMQGAVTYFEFDDQPTQNMGLTIARQIALAGYSDSEVCYGRIGVDTLMDVRAGIDHDSDIDTPDIVCEIVSNTTGSGYRATVNILTPSADYCGTDGCWASIRSMSVLRSTFDFVRPFDAGSDVLNAGYYENTADSLQYLGETNGFSGTWTTVAAPAASGGFVNKVSVSDDTTLRDGLGPVVSFLMDGTGFSVYFTNNAFADAVEICYQPDAAVEGTSQTERVQHTINNGICQIFDNQNAVPVYKVARRVLGLPSDVYMVTVQMLADNGDPAFHAPAVANITMELDAVEIHDTDWQATNALIPGRRYETHYRNRVIDNNFNYVGTGWITAEAPSLVTYSNRNYDLVRQHGAGIVFNTDANAVTFYANAAAAYAPFRICVTPADVFASRCQDYSQRVVGAGVQVPFTFQFADFGIQPGIDNVVSIMTLTNQPEYFDAIEVFDVYDDGNTATAPLTAGIYDATDAHVFYNNAYHQLVPNGAMDRNILWSNVGSPISVTSTTVSRYQGLLGYLVSANSQSGIQSTRFELLGETDTYTLVARVRVRSGSVSVRLVEGASTVSIPEFQGTTVSVSSAGLIWQTVRVEFSVSPEYYTGYESVLAQGLRVQFVAETNGTLFDVDDVSLSYGGQWQGEYSPIYTNRNIWTNKTHGASFVFAFEGTGFELGTVANVQGGEMEVCYVTQASYEANIATGDGFQNAHCFDYQQEYAINTPIARRAVTGLPYDVYHVRVRDVEDGFSNILINRPFWQRSPAYGVGKIAVDYIQIYNDAYVANAIATTMDALTVDAGFYDEDVVNADSQQYLRLSPAQNWKLQEGVIANAYSGQSYYGTIDALGRTDAASAGQQAVLFVDVPAGGAAIILNTGIPTATNSNTLLICAGDATTAGGFDGEVVWNGRNYVVEESDDCVIRDIRLNNVTVVSGADLAALDGSNPGPKRVMFTTLVRGLFYIDSYQVMYGSALSTGIYDNTLPDTLLNFNTPTTTAVDTVTPICNLVQLDSAWCVRKSAATYARSAAVTQDPNATLDFNIQGTGFSVITSISAIGVDFSICYGKTLSNGDTPNFPSRTQIATTTTARTLLWDNTSQNLDLGGIYCDVVTSNSARFLTRFPDRYLAVGYQYGFSYYGLPDGNYSVQVRMLEPLVAASTQVLEIDAIAVFSDYDDLPVMQAGFYDSAEAPISYEAAPYWQTQNYPLAYPAGAYGQSESISKYAGAIAQIQVDGNAITLYQTILTNRSRDVRVCLLITYATIHCMMGSDTTNEGIVEGGNAPYALAVDMTNFSQFGGTSYFTPIMFYGLGDGTHQIILENRDHNRFMGIDAIQVHE